MAFWLVWRTNNMQWCNENKTNEIPYAKTEQSRKNSQCLQLIRLLVEWGKKKNVCNEIKWIEIKRKIIGKWNNLINELHLVCLPFSCISQNVRLFFSLYFWNFTRYNSTAWYYRQKRDEQKKRTSKESARHLYIHSNENCCLNHKFSAKKCKTWQMYFYLSMGFSAQI